MTDLQLQIKELQEEGLDPMSVVSLFARLGSSDPIEAFTDIKDVIAKFDMSKFSRGTPKFDADELYRLNAKILHAFTFDDVKNDLSEMGLDALDSAFWTAVKPNLEKLSDIKEWWQVARGEVNTIIEDPEFIAQALEVLPATPWNENTWKEWTAAVKVKTGRKGKQLFMPLRQAITGMDHGPELASLLLLIGADNVKARLASGK